MAAIAPGQLAGLSGTGLAVSEEDVDKYIIGRAPFTDQPFFHKYILLILPAAASSQLLSISSPLLSSTPRPRRHGSNSNSSSSMERDLPPVPTNNLNPMAASLSNDGMLDFVGLADDRSTAWTSDGNGVISSKLSVHNLWEKMMNISETMPVFSSKGSKDSLDSNANLLPLHSDTAAREGDGQESSNLV